MCLIKSTRFTSQLRARRSDDNLPVTQREISRECLYYFRNCRGTVLGSVWQYLSDVHSEYRCRSTKTGTLHGWDSLIRNRGCTPERWVPRVTGGGIRGRREKWEIPTRRVKGGWKMGVQSQKTDQWIEQKLKIIHPKVTRKSRNDHLKTLRQKERTQNESFERSFRNRKCCERDLTRCSQVKPSVFNLSKRKY